MNYLKDLTKMKRNLLIVEDNIPLCQILSWDLEELGYGVTAVASCGAALRQADSVCPDLVLLDYCLPDGTGLELLKNLRSLYPNLPIVMMSATADQSVSVQAEAQGANAFVHKPLLSAELVNTFQQALG